MHFFSGARGARDFRGHETVRILHEKWTDIVLQILKPYGNTYRWRAQFERNKKRVKIENSNDSKLS